MKTLIRDFKRHYHRVTSVYSDLAKTGNFGFHAKSDGTTITSTCETPDPTKTVRFVAVMRRFLNDGDSLYYKTVWAALQNAEEFEIPSDFVERINSVIARVEGGYSQIKINDEVLSPQKIYETVSGAGYFSDDAKVAAYLQDVSRVPMVGALLLHQFYEYMLGGFSIASALFDAILFIEKQSKSVDTVTDNLCIYCLTTAGAFSSEEHIMAESLGNYDTVLPKGDVCDSCNHGTLSELDNALIKFEPIAWLRVYFVPFTKPGKLPEATFQNFSISKTGPRQITIKPKDKTGEIKTVEKIGDDLYRYNLTWKGKKIDWKIIARALFKIALGMVALKQGRTYACSSKFNSARAFIHGKIDIKNNMLVRMKCQPHANVQVVYLDAPEGTPFFIDIFGMAFIFNLEESPEIVLDDELMKLNFELVPLDPPRVSKAQA